MGKVKISQKVNIYTNHLNRNIFVFFLGGGGILGITEFRGV